MVRIEDISVKKFNQEEKKKLIKDLAEEFFGYAEINNFGFITIFNDGKAIGDILPDSDGIRLWKEKYEEEVREFKKIYEKEIMGKSGFNITTDYN